MLPRSKRGMLEGGEGFGLASEKDAHGLKTTRALPSGRWPDVLIDHCWKTVVECTLP